MSDFEYAIIGGGIHGAHIANKLVKDRGLDASELAVFDPDSYGEVFEERTSDSGTDYLRSPEVHHVAENLFNMNAYAEGRDRDDELISEGNNPKRPSTDLFMDHLNYVVESNNLDESLIEEYVTDLREDDRLILETDDDTYTAENGVLAVGTGRPNYLISLNRCRMMLLFTISSIKFSVVKIHNATMARQS